MMFSVIIPVYQESRIINNTIQHIRSLNNKKEIEIIVVDGDKERSTVKHIKDKNVIMITSTRSRGTQLNAGAEIANGKILIFLHVDTSLPFDAFKIIDQVINKEKHNTGAFNLSIDSPKIVFKIIGFVSSIRSRITRVPYGDQTFFIEKDYFFKIGKFKDFPIMEDVELMKRIRKRKDKIYIAHEKVLTSGRRWKKEGIIRCTLRNWTLVTLYNLGFNPEKLIKFYK